MTADHPKLPSGICDRIDPQPVRSRDAVYDGRVWDVLSDVIDLGEAGQVTRDYVQHTGAVAIVALRGEPGAEEVVLIQQYRHPVRTFDWEVPAGLLDQPGEDPRDAAARELREEAELDAHTWNVLVDLFTSPGSSSETIRVFLARDTYPATADGFVREGEEHGMPTGWLPLDDAVNAAVSGRLHNGPAVAGVLAADVARRRNWTTLRPADAPWPEYAPDEALRARREGQDDVSRGPR